MPVVNDPFSNHGEERINVRLGKFDILDEPESLDLNISGSKEHLSSSGDSALNSATLNNDSSHSDDREDDLRIVDHINQSLNFFLKNLKIIMEHKK